MRKTEKPQGFCQRCGGIYAITKDGTPTAHHITRSRGGIYSILVRERCPGSDQQVRERY